MADRKEQIRAQEGTGDSLQQVGNASLPCTMGELIDEFCAVLQRDNPASEETRRRYREYFEPMLRLLGDRDITAYVREDLLALKTRLYRWPARLDQLPDHRELTAAGILGLEGVKQLDKRTVDTKYMPKIEAAFQYAFRQGKIDRDITLNVTSTLTVAQRKALKGKAFDATDLQKIFAFLPFHRHRAYLAWIPLIALYSGARAGELCRLRVADIEGGGRIPFMRITEEDDRGTIVRNARNEESRRLVPLHPVLVTMGLLEFVALRKAEGRTLLFESSSAKSPECLPVPGAEYAQTFEAFTRRYVSKDLRKGFPSFRYNLHQELAALKIPLAVSHGLSGYLPQYEPEAADVVERLVAAKYRALVQLDYPCLDLPPLKEKYSRLIG